MLLLQFFYPSSCRSSSTELQWGMIQCVSTRFVCVRLLILLHRLPFLWSTSTWNAFWGASPVFMPPQKLFLKLSAVPGWGSGLKRCMHWQYIGCNFKVVRIQSRFVAFLFTNFFTFLGGEEGTNAKVCAAQHLLSKMFACVRLFFSDIFFYFG